MVLFAPHSALRVFGPLGSMSSISFPSERPDPSTPHDDFYSSPFEASSSFQINPLSAHPPRTPRTSITASGSTYDHNPYETTKEETQEVLHADEEDIDEPEDEKIKAETSVRREEVWRDLFLTSNGRDKAFVRYSYLCIRPSNF